MRCASRFIMHHEPLNNRQVSAKIQRLFSQLASSALPPYLPRPVTSFAWSTSFTKHGFAELRKSIRFASCAGEQRASINIARGFSGDLLLAPYKGTQQDRVRVFGIVLGMPVERNKNACISEERLFNELAYCRGGMIFISPLYSTPRTPGGGMVAPPNRLKRPPLMPRGSTLNTKPILSRL